MVVVEVVVAAVLDRPSPQGGAVREREMKLRRLFSIGFLRLRGEPRP